jgi:hypothetical protein
MEDDALIMVDREGHAFASMGLFATAKDAVRFGELYRNGGRNLDGEQVVPEAWVEASWDYSDETGGPRGYMWPQWSHGSFAAGYGHQRISVAPDLEMVGLRFGNDPVDTIAPKEFEAMYLAVADALGAGGADGPGNGKGGGKPDDPGKPGNPGKPEVADTPGAPVAHVLRDASRAPQGQLAASATDASSIPNGATALLVFAALLAASAMTTVRRSRRR